MKTWLLCLGMILIAQPLAAQSPAALTNVVLNLTPTDSLGLFLPGYDVIPEINFQVDDSVGISFIEVEFANSDSTVFTNISVPWNMHTSYTYQGITVRRVGLHIWLGLPMIGYSSHFTCKARLEDESGSFSSYGADSVSLSQ